MRTETFHKEISQGVPSLQDTLRTDEPVPQSRENDRRAPDQTSDPAAGTMPAEHSSTELEYMNQPEPIAAAHRHNIDIDARRELALSQNIAKAYRFIRDMPMTDSADDFAVARDELAQEIAEASEMAKHMNITDALCEYSHGGTKRPESIGDVEAGAPEAKRVEIEEDADPDEELLLECRRLGALYSFD